MIVANGISLYYERSGAGPRLLFCNGTGSTLATSGPLINVHRPAIRCGRPRSAGPRARRDPTGALHDGGVRRRRDRLGRRRRVGPVPRDRHHPSVACSQRPLGHRRSVNQSAGLCTSACPTRTAHPTRSARPRRSGAALASQASTPAFVRDGRDIDVLDVPDVADAIVRHRAIEDDHEVLAHLATGEVSILRIDSPEPRWLGPWFRGCGNHVGRCVASPGLIDMAPATVSGDDSSPTRRMAPAARPTTAAGQANPMAREIAEDVSTQRVIRPHAFSYTADRPRSRVRLPHLC